MQAMILTCPAQRSQVSISMLNTRLSLFRAEETLDVDDVIGFHFSDSDRHFRVHIRRGVAIVTEGQLPAAGSVIVTAEQTWKELAAGLRSPAAAVASGDIGIEGGVIALLRFLGYFEKSVRN